MKAHRILVIAAVLIVLGPAWGVASDVFHFALRDSAPTADATVSAPEEVRLWFTQAPQTNSVGIRLIDASGDAVGTTDPAADPEDGRAVFVKPSARLGSGRYTVAWRGIGDDGHVVRGEFTFAVTAE